jgi:hypothetical protein
METEKARPPDLMKIDVEGAELAVLRGAERLIGRFRPSILLDTHDFLGPKHEGLHEQCLRALRDFGYSRIETDVTGPFSGTIAAAATG